jgi:hypothetical protein
MKNISYQGEVEMARLLQKYMIPLLLIVWFWVWGICPWNNAAAPTVEGPRTEQSHHGVDDTHHASKGTEHSCSGSISFTKTDLKAASSLYHTISTQEVSLISPAMSVDQIDRFLKPLIERSTLPKLLTEFYQLYSIYRI